VLLLGPRLKYLSELQPSLIEMKVIAAYLLAGLGGNSSPSADDIKKILSSGKWQLLCLLD